MAGCPLRSRDLWNEQAEIGARVLKPGETSLSRSSPQSTRSLSNRNTERCLNERKLGAHTTLALLSECLPLGPDGPILIRNVFGIGESLAHTYSLWASLIVLLGSYLSTILEAQDTNLSLLQLSLGQAD